MNHKVMAKNRRFEIVMACCGRKTGIVIAGGGRALAMSVCRENRSQKTEGKRLTSDFMDGGGAKQVLTPERRASAIGGIHRRKRASP